jgi:CRP-like cAMP-binding protein
LKSLPDPLLGQLLANADPLPEQVPHGIIRKFSRRFTHQKFQKKIFQNYVELKMFDNSPHIPPVFRQGEHLQDWYLLLSGEVQLYLEEQPTTSSSRNGDSGELANGNGKWNQRQQLAIVRPGTLFGELQSIPPNAQQSRHSCAARVLKSAEFVRIRQDHFLNVYNVRKRENIGGISQGLKLWHFHIEMGRPAATMYAPNGGFDWCPPRQHAIHFCDNRKWGRSCGAAEERQQQQSTIAQIPIGKAEESDKKQGKGTNWEWGRRRSSRRPIHQQQQQ